VRSSINVNFKILKLDIIDQTRKQNTRACDKFKVKNADEDTTIYTE
jgi:hypothetical protein